MKTQESEPGQRRQPSGGRRPRRPGRRISTTFQALALVAAMTLTTVLSHAQISGSSQQVSWVCTGSPCPWGTTLTGYALVWPEEMGAQSGRLGYTTSAGIYLAAALAAGLTVEISEGSVALYAGLPDAPSHRALATVSAGDSFVVSGLAAGEVVSAQSDGPFTHTLTPAPLPTATATAALPTATATALPSVTPTASPQASATTTPESPGPAASSSQEVSWVCTGSPCPWGTTLAGSALVWPEEMGAQSGRLGYTTSAGIYLAATLAAGLTVEIGEGVVALYAGLPDAPSHQMLAALAAGESYVIGALPAGAVVSVQSDASFMYMLTPGSTEAEPTATPEEPSPTPEEPTATPEEPSPTPELPCTDTQSCEPVDSVDAVWRCDIAGCSEPEWAGAVVTWPAWSAHPHNGRELPFARTVYATDGAPLYPYMGAWASGCTVTALAGEVVIIEWQWGSEEWRSTLLQAGESHTITLTAPENGAMIEGIDFSQGFRVSLSNCTPQLLESHLRPEEIPS
jgi:hypothetical protein